MCAHLVHISLSPTDRAALFQAEVVLDTLQRWESSPEAFQAELKVRPLNFGFQWSSVATPQCLRKTTRIQYTL
jgi:hypothetical protein